MSFAAHLEGKLASLNADFDQPVRSLPRARRAPVYKGRTPPAPDHRTASLMPGARFDWLGYPARLDISGHGSPEFTRNGYGRWLQVSWSATVADITAMYAREGAAWVSDRPRIRDFETRMGLESVRYESRDLGERPARCFPGRRLVVLHWALFELSPPLVDYAVAGQLASLVLGHTRRTYEWWRQMGRVSLTGDDEDRFNEAWAHAWTGGGEEQER